MGTIKLGDFLMLYRNQHVVQDDTSYRQVTISKNHGISFRGVKLGKRIGRKRQFVIDLKNHPNTVLFTRQGVLDGAIGIAPIEVDKCIVTENMPMMSVDTDVIVMPYLKKLLLSDYLYDKIRLLNVVGSAQKSIHERELLNIEIQIPGIEVQKEVCSKFDALDAEHEELITELTHQQALLKKLRQQILQEAIEGKLTADWRTKNPDIEPASELLKRIQAEKEQLIKDKKIKKQKSLLALSEEETPFVLPAGWEWCRLGDAMDYLTDYHANGAYEKLRNNVQLLDKPDFAIMIRTTNFHHRSKFKYKYITEDAYEFLSKSKVYPEDVIMNKIADPGAVFFVDDRKQPMSLAMNLFLLRFHQQYISSKYAYFYLKATYEYVVSFSSGTATPTITKDAVKNLRFPLPPLSEQKAIVTKVEKLLTLCDQLETQITNNQTHAEQLIQAVLKEAFTQNSKHAGKVRAKTAKAATKKPMKKTRAGSR